MTVAVNSACQTFRPARYRRAFFCGLLAVFLSGLVSAQPVLNTPPAELSQIFAPNQAEAREILEQFRQGGIDGDYYLDFQLRVMPRRGPERTVSGRMWGARTATGEVSRVVLGTGADEQRLLVESGVRPRVWKAVAGGPAEAVSEDGVFVSLAGTELTAFDLLRTYIHWPDAVFERLARTSNRVTYSFLLRAPAGPTARPAGAPAAMRVQLDTAYRALLRTEALDAANQPTKSMTVRDFQRIGERYLVRSVDLRNERTGDVTRFLVKAAAVGLELPADLFTPERLGAQVAPPDKLTRIP